MKKRFRYISAFLILMLSVSMLIGCGSEKKDEELIRTALTEELDSIKNQDEELMKEYEQTIGVDQLAAFGIDANKFMSEYLAGFDYSIKEITVEDKKATANITLKCRSFVDYQAKLEEASKNMFSDLEVLSQMSEEEMQLKMGEMIMETISELEVKETEPIDIEYELVGDMWTPTAEAQTQITNALLGN